MTKSTITTVSLLHVGLLFVYFSARYVLECILLRLPSMRIEMPDNCDLQAHKFVGRLINAIYICKQILLPAFAFVTQSPLLFFFVSYRIYIKEWINSYVYFCFTHWPFLVAYWTIPKALSSAKLREKDLWNVLGRFVSFTRISVGRGHIEDERKCGVQPDFGRLPTVVPLVVQAVVSAVIIVGLTTRVFSVIMHSRHHFSPSEHRYYINHHNGADHDGYMYMRSDFQRPSFPYHYHPIAAPPEFGSATGPRRSPNSQKLMDPGAGAVANTFPHAFTAVIPSCYDGDTCYTSNLSFNGQPLPDMFAAMKIRLLGIDTPELSRANCELERCLARQAKHEIERIVESGRGYVLALQKCKPDKYGGRMVCDILTREGEVVSKQMLEAGLAVSYGGKKKEFSWCQHRKGPKKLKARIDECLVEICPWHKSGSTNDCQDAFTD